MQSCTGSVLGCLLGKNPVSKGFDFQKTLSICLQNSSSVRAQLITPNHESLLAKFSHKHPHICINFSEGKWLKCFIQTAHERSCLGLCGSLLHHFLPFIFHGNLFLSWSGAGDALPRTRASIRKVPLSATWDGPAEEQQLQTNISLQSFQNSDAGKNNCIPNQVFTLLYYLLTPQLQWQL